MTVMARPLESALFGVPIMSASVGAPGDVAVALAEARRQCAQLIVLRVPADAVSTAQAIETQGGVLCDVLITFDRTIDDEGFVTGAESPVHRVRPSGLGDRDAVSRLSGLAFHGALTHWHADARLSSETADQLYARWAADLVERATSRNTVLVAENSDGAIQGFLASAIGPDGLSAQVPLTAVDSRARGQGILGQLLASWSRHVGAAGVRTLCYETQLNNHAAIRAVSRCGFILRASRMTFHLWTDTP